MDYERCKTEKGKMVLCIIRHGQSKADLENSHEGRADFALTETANKQA